VNKNLYDLIDRELEDLFQKSDTKKWKTSPVRVKTIDHR
jgi:hypothetical protein